MDSLNSEFESRTTQTTILIPTSIAELLHNESFKTHKSKSRIIRELLEAHYQNNLSLAAASK